MYIPYNKIVALWYFETIEYNLNLEQERWQQNVRFYVTIKLI